MQFSHHIRSLAEYNRWMNERLYEASSKLSDEERKRDLRAFFRSVHGTLNHLLLADRAWMVRFTGDLERFASRRATGEEIVIRALDQVLYGDFDELRRERTVTDDAICAWARALDESALEAPITYRTSTGGRYRHPLALAVAHFFNHQTHHRGQVTTLLSQLGVDVGVTDLIELVRTGEHRITG